MTRKPNHPSREVKRNLREEKRMRNPDRVQLAPCPFLHLGNGGQNTARLIDKGAGTLPHRVECSVCHASTAPYRLQNYAVEAWNRRAK